ncbi:TPA: DNA repair protein [Streptococcus suis]|uniref:DNA repair protein n=1 Tax=Streptococcus suis 6407 TaxID=1214179 RepID=A0A075SPK4_STRSU|nr:DNA repair protein [Streptococcus suis]AIG42945.1 DNA repair protein [Streptococcus suis 6407]MCK3921975.1 DNA repair protein [Streptococcus suis]MCK3952983.1 DNA repair protein [Streptococcus suis]MCK4056910.1 DNA repair protein [Streptococcus suis]MDW8585411.1 DNA repair protein [Streptococcus suis]
MDVKNLRKLKRIELYEIMLAQSEEIDCLRNQLEKIKTELADRRIMISQSGSVAEASMKLTNIFEEAQKAADLYLYNVKNKIGDVHE